MAQILTQVEQLKKEEGYQSTKQQAAHPPRVEEMPKIKQERQSKTKKMKQTTDSPTFKVHIISI